MSTAHTKSERGQKCNDRFSLQNWPALQKAVLQAQINTKNHIHSNYAAAMLEQLQLCYSTYFEINRVFFFRKAHRLLTQTLVSSTHLTIFTCGSVCSFQKHHLGLRLQSGHGGLKKESSLYSTTAIAQRATTESQTFKCSTDGGMVCCQFPSRIQSASPLLYFQGLLEIILT